ncbi:hypothetical protein F2Q68_00008469 [Brassica cretica]|uniref:Uncharacterized protein n=1 Tax=Brassica cretica TaxID=69181 RepID=A0A8S9KVR8_BRACR|nr:hypothetical protein F2Q68_00008469 [Brassica cretica]
MIVVMEGGGGGGVSGGAPPQNNGPPETVLYSAPPDQYHLPHQHLIQWLTVLHVTICTNLILLFVFVYALQENTPNSDGDSDGHQCRRMFVMDYRPISDENQKFEVVGILRELQPTCLYCK